MAIPKNLKIGDTFEEAGFRDVFRYKVTGFDSHGNYFSECIGKVTADSKKAAVVEEPVVVADDEEKKPIEEMLSEATPEKKPATRKAPAKRKRTPAKKA